MLWIKFFFTFLILLILGGCIAIPLPAEKHQYTQEMERKVEIGKTSRDEIIQLLGKPELSNSKTHLIYRLPRESMKFLMIAGGGGGGAMGIVPFNRSDYVLLMEFNEAEILEKFEALVYVTGSYDTIINPSSPKIPQAKPTKVFSLDTNISYFFFSRTTPIGFRAIAYGPDGKHLAALGTDNESMVYTFFLINSETKQSKVIKNDVTRDSIFSPDISKLSYTKGTSFVIFDANTSNIVFEKDKGFWGYVFTTTAFNSDGTLIAAGNYEGSISVWDYQKNQEIFSFQYSDKEWIDSIAFSMDNRWIAVARSDNNLTLWDIKTNSIFASEQAASGIIKFSPDNAMIAINSQDHVHLWEIKEFESEKIKLKGMFTLPGKLWDSWPKLSSYSLAFSPDGKYIAAVNGSLIVYDIQKQQKVIQYCKSKENQTSFESINSITFSSDGKHVIGGTSSGIYAWTLPED